jgi:hypothetical protein
VSYSKKETKNTYKEFFLECPRCNNYFSLEQLAEILEKKGMNKESIEKFCDEIAFADFLHKS